MARNPSSFAKRQRELARQRKRVDKARKKTERRNISANGADAANGGDPDLAGIVAGPQAHLYMSDEELRGDTLEELDETDDEEEQA